MHKVPANLVSYYATKIKEHWQKALVSIFAVSDLLIEAKMKLDLADWERLKDELPFSESVSKKLFVIGNDARLREARLYQLLPVNYTILYEVTQLDDEELDAAVKQGEIWPRMNRAAFIAWRNQMRSGLKDQGVSKRIPSIVSASIFAAVSIYPDAEQLPFDKALKLTKELTSIWKRYGPYGVHISYGGQATAVWQRARAKLADEFRAEFHKGVAKINTGIDQKKLDLIESALWQHRTLEAGESLPYSPEHPDSIEYKKHTYSVHRGWTYKKLIKETRQRQIITTWTPIKDVAGLGRAKCLQLAIAYLESKYIFQRDRFRVALESIANGESRDSKFAQACLKRLVDQQW
jgi:hypothetical protein